MSASGTPLTTYVESHDADRLRELARDADRSVAGEIRHAIRLHLKSESPAGQPSFREDTAGHRRDASG